MEGFRPKVSVVMNCFNGERYLRQALDSVFAQTYDNWEVVFFDNASTDASAAIARSYGEKVRYHRADSTTNLGQARLAAFSHVTGDLAAMLDTDDLWEPDKLALQVPLFEADKRLGLVYCDAQVFDDAGNTRRFFEATLPARGLCFAQLLQRNFICTGTMLFSRQALAEVTPLFEPDMTMIMDYLLTLKVAYARPLDYIDKVLVGNRVHSASESSRKWVLFARELASAYDNILATLPGVAQRYGPQLAQARRGADLQLAMDAWALGLTAQARQALAPHFGRAALPTLVSLGTRLYPRAFPAEALRRLKYRLAGLLGRPRSPFRPHDLSEHTTHTST